MNDLFGVSMNSVFMNDDMIQLLLVSINACTVLTTLNVQCWLPVGDHKNTRVLEFKLRAYVKVAISLS
jgi:hypothetical protein